MTDLDRRNHIRHRISALTYVSVDDSAGGILLDISEGGMGVQVVGTFQRNQPVRFAVQLSGAKNKLTGSGQVAWANPSGQAGIKMLEVSDESRQKLKEWLFANALAGVDTDSSVELPAPTRRNAGGVATVMAGGMEPATTAPPGSLKPVRRPVPKPPIKPGLLLGPFPLTVRHIEANVSSDAKGVYVLGEGMGRQFEVLKVGRSDDVKGSLGEYLGKYKNFQYAFALSQVEAWDRECELYHQFRPRDNKAHPVRRYGSDWDCPVCHGFS
jgi:Tfp pilus assembly protein PilZ